MDRVRTSISYVLMCKWSFMTGLLGHHLFHPLTTRHNTCIVDTCEAMAGWPDTLFSRARPRVLHWCRGEFYGNFTKFLVHAHAIGTRALHDALSQFVWQCAKWGTFTGVHRLWPIFLRGLACDMIVLLTKYSDSWSVSFLTVDVRRHWHQN